LGSSKQFSGFVKNLAERPQNPYGQLRELVRPYILRRLKTDKSIIGDLPDKTEIKTFCPLSRKLPRWAQPFSWVQTMNGPRVYQR
jgi:non-specific serine/threonine protein kinase